MLAASLEDRHTITWANKDWAKIIQNEENCLKELSTPRRNSSAFCVKERRKVRGNEPFVYTVFKRSISQWVYY